VDQRSFSVEPFLADAYAGISPVIDTTYSMYEGIKTTSQKAGVNMPDRTFVIYANRKPLYDFFCYRQEI